MKKILTVILATMAVSWAWAADYSHEKALARETTQRLLVQTLFCYQDAAVAVLSMHPANEDQDIRVMHKLCSAPAFHHLTSTQGGDLTIEQAGGFLDHMATGEFRSALGRGR